MVQPDDTSPGIVVSLERAVQKLLGTGEPISSDAYYRVDGYDLKLAPVGNGVVVTDVRLNDTPPEDLSFPEHSDNGVDENNEPIRSQRSSAGARFELHPGLVKALGYETSGQEELDGENKTDTNDTGQQEGAFPSLDADADPGDFYTYVRAGYGRREAADRANEDALARRQTSEAAGQAKLPPRKVPADAQTAQFAKDNPDEFNKVLYELHRKIIAVRLDRKYNTKIRNDGNMGVATIRLAQGDIPRDIFALSAIDTPDEKMQSVGFVGRTPQLFDTTTIPNANGDDISRDHDSEYKILNHLENVIGPNTSTFGSIDLLSERAPCESCTAVIEAFRRRYPNIRLRVYDRSDTIGRPR